jgi:hypothetical protein
MGEITIPAGDTKKIVSSPGYDEAYQLDVNDGDVFVSHDPQRTKAEGKLVTPDDRGDLRNFKGDDVYAFAPDGATVRINEQAFELSLFPRRVVERPTDQAARSGNVDSDYGDLTLVDGGVDFVDAYENTTGGTVYLQMVPFEFTDTASLADARPEWSIQAAVMVRDADNNVDFSFSMNAGHFPFVPEQPLPVEDGGVVRGVVNNNTSAERTFTIGAIVRTDE